jgi:hypothetical protein
MNNLNDFTPTVATPAPVALPVQGSVLPTVTPPSDFWRADPKGAIDRVLGKFSSRKFLCFVIATIAMFTGFLDAVYWGWIAVAYIGSQAFADIFTQAAMVRLAKSSTSKSFDTYRPTYGGTTGSLVGVEMKTLPMESLPAGRNPPISSIL